MRQTRFQWSKSALVLRAVIAIAVLMLLGGIGYRVIDPNRSDNLASVPAVVPMAPASPSPQEYSTEDHPLVGTWEWKWAPWDPQGGDIGVAIFNTDGTAMITTNDFDLVWGTWRATGKQTAEFVEIAQHPVELDSVIEPGTALPELFGSDVATGYLALTVSDDGSSLDANGFYDPRGTDGTVLDHLSHDGPPGKEMAATRMTLSQEPQPPTTVPPLFASPSPASTPDPSTFDMSSHPILGAWQFDYNDGLPGTNLRTVVFHSDGSFSSADEDGSMMIGTWRPTNEHAVEVVWVALKPTQFDTFTEGNLPIPEELFSTADWGSGYWTIDVDDSGNSFVVDGYMEPRNAAGTVLIHLDMGLGSTAAFGTRLISESETNATPTA